MGIIQKTTNKIDELSFWVTDNWTFIILILFLVMFITIIVGLFFLPLILFFAIALFIETIIGFMFIVLGINGLNKIAYKLKVNQYKLTNIELGKHKSLVEVKKTK